MELRKFIATTIHEYLNEMFDGKSTFKRNVYGSKENYRSMTKERAIIWDNKNNIAFQYIFDDREVNGFTFVHLYPYFEEDSYMWDRLSTDIKAKIFLDAINKLPKVLGEYMKKFGNIDKVVFRPKTEQMGRIYSSKSFLNMLNYNFVSKYTIEVNNKDDYNFPKNTIIMELKNTITTKLNTK